jgi:bifunctional DNA-binding transcriptional regulator/antitoxin component of YhaV-PrlF toxin-antitoxin module
MPRIVPELSRSAITIDIITNNANVEKTLTIKNTNMKKEFIGQKMSLEMQGYHARLASILAFDRKYQITFYIREELGIPHGQFKECDIDSIESKCGTIEYNVVLKIQIRKHVLSLPMNLRDFVKGVEKFISKTKIRTGIVVMSFQTKQQVS